MRSRAVQRVTVRNLSSRGEPANRREPAVGDAAPKADDAAAASDHASGGTVDERMAADMDMMQQMNAKLDSQGNTLDAIQSQPSEVTPP